MHGNVLKFVPIRKNKISVEFEAALPEAFEDTDNLFSREELQFRHMVYEYRRAAGS